MMNIEYPANAQFAASTIIEILNADVLNPQLLHDLMFDFENDWDLERILETDERYFGLNIVP